MSLAGIGIRQQDEHTFAQIEYVVSPIPKLNAPARKDQLFNFVLIKPEGAVAFERR